MSMYHTICTIHWYDTIHTIRTYVSDNSWALMIRPYDTKFFVHDTYHLSYDTDNYVERFRGYFSNILGFGLSSSFKRFWEYFGHFQGLKCILVIFRGLEGILVIFRGLMVFWSFFRFQWYFGHFRGFGGILVIF